jgi:hypothetical protein
MPLPENRKRSETVAGGTAVGQESHMSLWLGLGALVLVVGAVGYVAMGDDEKPVPSASATVEADDETLEAARPLKGQPSDNGEVGISLDDAPESEGDQRRQTLASFEQGLSAGRLWSTVTIEGTTLSLVSGACADESMRPTISKFSATLAEAGFTSIRCLEKHGAQVFEQGL